eukprot:Selendium_serpulae@DN5025_c2_g1_i4.p1
MRKLLRPKLTKKKDAPPRQEMGNRGSCCSDVSRPDNDEDTESDDDDDVVDDLPDMPPNFNPKKNRTSVSAEAYGEWNKKGLFTAPVHVKTEEQKDRIKNTISKSFLFNSLEKDDLKTVIDAFQELKVANNVTIINQGDEGDCLYLIEDGECKVWKKKPEDAEAKQVFVQQPGDAFGELALLYNCPRAATVVSDGECLLWKLDRECFNHIVKDAAQRKREMHESFLKEVKILHDMDPYERSKLSDALKTEVYPPGAVIIKEGDSGDVFYIIETGTAEALKGDKVVMSYKKGDYFGELALIKDQPRAATVRAKGPCKVVTLKRQNFKRLLGPVEKILERNTERYETVRRQLSGPIK